MALITLVAARVRAVEIIHASTKPAAVAITRGQIVFCDTNGKWALSLTTSLAAAGFARGWALKDVGAGEPLTALRIGILDVGDGLDAAGMALGAQIFGNDTGGSIGTAAGTATVINGVVVSGWASGSVADKLVWVNMGMF